MRKTHEFVVVGRAWITPLILRFKPLYHQQVNAETRPPPNIHLPQGQVEGFPGRCCTEQTMDSLFAIPGTLATWQTKPAHPPQEEITPFREVL